ncbi:MAG TPA: tetratricopeptide repeat-containing protein, partial [Chitinophagaceae bacterium]|nr:tetratricopeptide repeat-containing protein [Chitinophagaceae bacterium]
MLQAFIVRPFGTKQGVDFDKVERELIQPALKKAGIAGSTTAAIMEQGNIREDMFSLLLTADLVVADLSIHNANVFYELGIRHALRDKRTFLIRCSMDEIPFDLKTDRYLSYDAADPAASVEVLMNGLKATAWSDRQDSPVFYMLPKLEAQDPERLLAVPFDYAEEVGIAIAGRQTGKLSLLGIEADGFPWEIPALRLVGASQFKLKLFDDARLTWEKIRGRYPSDLEANTLLATIYQRLAESDMATQPNLGLELLQKSDEAIRRLLANYDRLKKYERAEIYALKARNEKYRWIETWTKVAGPERLEKALQSPFLKQSFEYYERGYHEDLNHVYSGVNALSLLTIMVSLAERLRSTWEINYDTEEDAMSSLVKYKEKQQRLATVVTVSVGAEKSRLERTGTHDPWLDMSEADLTCLTSKKPQRVGALFQQVVQHANDLNYDSAKRQLQLYEQLNVVPENVKAALAAFSATKADESDTKKHYILFTGHMLDQPGRPIPRFPAAMEATAKTAIREAIQREKEKIETDIVGMAGGASGGDILFHEACAELGIRTELFLALPREQFVVESVQKAGAEWIERFDRLYKKLPRRGLAQTKELPNWLQKKPGYSIWERNNLWMLQSALVAGGMQMTLIALWDGEQGDGPGGTRHMLAQAMERGAKTIVIDSGKLFGLGER